jgi:hypothetical protein
VTLKKDLLESAGEVAHREATRGSAGALRQSVDVLERSSADLSQRVGEVDADIFSYKGTGRLMYSSVSLRERSSNSVKLLELYQEQEAP